VKGGEMKLLNVMLAVFVVISVSLPAVVTTSLAADKIKVGEIQTYSRLTSFTFPYRNGWLLALL
jgi:hypothetical protein